MLQSMSDADNPYDNAHMESFFSRFKAELLEGGAFQNAEDSRSEEFSSLLKCITILQDCILHLAIYHLTLMKTSNNHMQKSQRRILSSANLSPPEEPIKLSPVKELLYAPIPRKYSWQVALQQSLFPLVSGKTNIFIFSIVE